MTIHLGQLPEPDLSVTIAGVAAPQGSKQARAVYKGQRIVNGKRVGGQFTGRVAMVEMSKRVKPWRADVQRHAALAMQKVGHVTQVSLEHLPAHMRLPYELDEAMLCRRSRCPEHGLPWDEPIVAGLVITRAKPSGAPKKRRTYADTQPDISKLTRSTEDAVTDIGLWSNDGRIVGYCLQLKVYPGEGSLWPGCPDYSLPTPGARLLLWRASMLNTPLPIPGTDYVQDVLQIGES